MPTDLERFRDYARHMATEPFEGRQRSAPCRGDMFGAPRKPHHKACPRGTSCDCECHRPSDRERALWLQLADEIDYYLAPPDNEPPIVAALAFAVVCVDGPCIGWTGSVTARPNGDFPPGLELLAPETEEKVLYVPVVEHDQHIGLALDDRGRVKLRAS